jgi:hypothetical protein
MTAGVCVGVMKTLSSWDTVLAAPGPCDHLVQLYTSEDALASTVVRFIRHGLADGEGVVAIATAAHWAKITEGLTTAGIDVATAQGNSQLVVCDAHDTLARFMIYGMPDRSAMRTAVMSALDSARDAGHSKVRVRRDGRHSESPWKPGGRHPARRAVE